jgi:hypothetical protein
MRRRIRVRSESKHGDAWLCLVQVLRYSLFRMSAPLSFSLSLSFSPSLPLSPPSTSPDTSVSRAQTRKAAAAAAAGPVEAAPATHSKSSSYSDFYVLHIVGLFCLYIRSLLVGFFCLYVLHIVTYIYIGYEYKGH